MRISITWQIMGGTGQATDEYPVKSPLGAVKIIAMAAMDGVNPSDAGNYDVVDMNGQRLDESKTLEELGIADGARLILKAKA